MLTNSAAFELVQYIASNDLQIGAKLPSIRELALQMNCGKSRVRTGLIGLAALGVVDLHPRAGAFVRSLSPHDLDALLTLLFRFGMPGVKTDVIGAYTVKMLLDREIFVDAARFRTESDLFKLEHDLELQEKSFEDNRSYTEADEAFHRHLALISRNALLALFQDVVLSMIRSYRHKHLTAQGNQESYRSHLALFEAVRSRDEEKAERIAAQHTMQRLRKLKEENEYREARVG